MSSNKEGKTEEGQAGAAPAAGAAPGATEETPAADAKKEDESVSKMTAAQLAEIDKAVKSKEEELRKAITAEVTKALEEKAETEKQAKAGEFEKLYNDEKGKLEAATSKIADLEASNAKLLAIVDDEIAAKKKATPKDILELMPEYEDRSKILEWLRKASEKVSGGQLGYLGENPNFSGPKDGKAMLEQTVTQFAQSGLYEN